VLEPNKILLVDVGNTRVKYAIDDGQRLSTIMVVSRLSELPLGGFSEIRVATVSRHDEIDHWKSEIAVNVRQAKVIKQHHNLTVAYNEVERLGVDRWLAMLAVWCEKKTPTCVVDLGTAITADYVSSEGVHLGGYIIPGFLLMKQSLGNNTACVGFGSNGKGVDPGSVTEACVDNGINRLVRSFLKDLLQAEPACHSLVVTGGDSSRLDYHGFEADISVDEALVLRGLRYAFE
jgi:type III pantothenate kinase